MIDPRLAVIFEARLAWTQETDKETRVALWRKFEAEVGAFCKQEGLQISPGDFLHFTRDALREWRRSQPGKQVRSEFRKLISPSGGARPSDRFKVRTTSGRQFGRVAWFGR